jgi:hypothetical protein
MSSESDLAHKLRVIARLMAETKAPVIFEEQDAAKLRKAADELENLLCRSGSMFEASTLSRPRRARGDHGRAQ